MIMQTATIADEVGAALRVSIGLLVRTMRQVRAPGDLTLPETSALARLDRGGPTTAALLARAEQISPQSMGATIGALEARGLVVRRPDPDDGRRAVISPTGSGLEVLRGHRSARTELLARALARDFTPAEVEQLRVAAPLIERLAHAI
jgi:DNA-binding MarR family transcriptional regulator